MLAPIAREKGVSEFLVTPSPGAGATFDDENSAIARAVLELLQGTSGFERLDEVCGHTPRIPTQRSSTPELR